MVGAVCRQCGVELPYPWTPEGWLAWWVCPDCGCWMPEEQLAEKQLFDVLEKTV